MQITKFSFKIDRIKNLFKITKKFCLIKFLVYICSPVHERN